MFEGLSGAFVFLALVTLSHYNKPMCFVLCVVLGVLMLSGVN